MKRTQPVKKRMFLNPNASPRQVAQYDRILTIVNAENEMLIAAEQFLRAHGYTVKFNHKRKKS